MEYLKNKYNLLHREEIKSMNNLQGDMNNFNITPHSNIDQLDILFIRKINLEN
jgi:hypothetical protein